VTRRRRSSIRPPIALLGVLAVAGAVGVPAVARAQMPPELRCQVVLGKSARAYVKTVHRVRASCENLILNGATCDAAGDAARITAAFAVLENALALRCTDAHLSALGFPGQCPDDGAPFTVAELAACIRDTHRARIEVMIAIEYPGPPGAPDRGTAHCGEHVGRTVGLVDRHARARQRCLNLQKRGVLPGAVDCLDDSRPFATGDAKTDKGLTQGNNWSANQLTLPCQRKTLEELGFPGSCADPDGSPFTLDELTECIEATHSALTIELVQIQHPPAP
jgi:hypothetical protein